MKPGQELARIDTTDTRLALQAARAERALAEAELRLRLNGSRIEDVREAEAQVVRAQADLEGAQKDLDRMEGLLTVGSGTTKARDDARTRRDVAKASLDAARERERRLEAGSRREEIDGARARVAAAEARIAQLEQQLADAVIVSPVAGVVTEKLAEVGELAARGTGIVVVTDLPNAWVNAYVTEPDLSRIRLGPGGAGDHRRRPDAQGPALVRGLARRVHAQERPDAGRAREARLPDQGHLENADGLFKPGMPATARLQPAAGQP